MAGESPAQAEPPLLCLAGPTAVGKSEIALHLAEQLGGEIISVDSMQVYRGLDIGTAKPDAAERARVPHHLIDVADLFEAFDAAQFVELANRAIAEIHRRGRRPILCGGTGLYFKALLEGLGNAPPSDQALRAELERTPLAELLRELDEKDPATAARIDRQNPRRVFRAVEVIRLTGKPFSGQRASWTKEDNSVGGFQLIGLTREPGDLHARIDVRVDRMFARGLVAETRALLDQGLAQNRNAQQALGYRQVIEHLRGEHALAQTIALVKQRTRQFARRQRTWFRHQLAVVGVELQPGESTESGAARVMELIR
jgi:tRNA dimethylallyltransferase